MPSLAAPSVQLRTFAARHASPAFATASQSATAPLHGISKLLPAQALPGERWRKKIHAVLADADHVKGVRKTQLKADHTEDVTVKEGHT